MVFFSLLGIFLVDDFHFSDRSLISTVVSLYFPHIIVQVWELLCFRKESHLLILSHEGSTHTLTIIRHLHCILKSSYHNSVYRRVISWAKYGLHGCFPFYIFFFQNVISGTNQRNKKEISRIYLNTTWYITMDWWYSMDIGHFKGRNG